MRRGSGLCKAGRAHGLMAASVWMTLRTGTWRGPGVWISRPTPAHPRHALLAIKAPWLPPHLTMRWFKQRGRGRGLQRRQHQRRCPA